MRLLCRMMQLSARMQLGGHRQKGAPTQHQQATPQQARLGEGEGTGPGGTAGGAAWSVGGAGAGSGARGGAQTGGQPCTPAAAAAGAAGRGGAGQEAALARSARGAPARRAGRAGRGGRRGFLGVYTCPPNRVAEGTETRPRCSRYVNMLSKGWGSTQRSTVIVACPPGSLALCPTLACWPLGFTPPKLAGQGQGPQREGRQQAGQRGACCRQWPGRSPKQLIEVAFRKLRPLTTTGREASLLGIARSLGGARAPPAARNTARGQSGVLARRLCKQCPTAGPPASIQHKGWGGGVG